MPSTDRRVDAYIAAAAPFAQPILERLREDVHAACADVVEAMKWSMPFFMHRGRNLAHMAAFKAHCAFGFEHGRAVVDLGREAQAMGQFGRITTLEDLPPRAELRRFVKKAVALIDAGVKPPRAPKSGVGTVLDGELDSGPDAGAVRRGANGGGANGGGANGAAGRIGAAPHPRAGHVVVVPELPPAFAAALARKAVARRFFDSLAASHRRDYVLWIAEARREETRQRRIAQALDWLAEGKRRNWRYERR
jgi:uncharacterized protein YdeI (YjbR/CyaY-like superfamily)